MAATMQTDNTHNVRSARHSTSSPMPCRPMASPPTPSGTTANCGSCPVTARSATWRSSIPVICAVDRGMVKGLLASIYGETEVELIGSVARGDDACVTDVLSS